MEDLWDIAKKAEEGERKMDEMVREFTEKLHIILFGPSSTSANGNASSTENATDSPQQKKKRVKRLSSLREVENENISPRVIMPVEVLPTKDLQISAVGQINETSIADNTVLKDAQSKNNIDQAVALMPPPPPPANTHNVTDVANKSTVEQSFTRPQRAARLKTEKNLKEPKLNSKLRRPNDDEVQVKLEHENRASQINESTKVTKENSKDSLHSSKSDDTIVVVPSKTPSIVELSDDDITTEAIAEKEKNTETETNDQRELSTEKSDGTTKKERVLKVKIKREKLSFMSGDKNETTTVTQEIITQEISAESTSECASAVASTIPVVKNESLINQSTASASLSAVSTIVSNKKSRKKKDLSVPKPIKVERFSDIADQPTAIAGRTRKKSADLRQQETSKQQTSIYEDAVEELVAETQPVNTDTTGMPNTTIALQTTSTENNNSIGDKPNGTMLISPMGDATFNTNQAQSTFVVSSNTPNANATVTSSKNPTGDVTYDVNADGGDATFNIAQKNSSSGNSGDNAQTSFGSMQLSMETAKDVSQPRENYEDDLMTEDESFERNMPVQVKQTAPKAVQKKTKATKAYKMPTRTNELFNPLVQSPVKKKVEAFETAISEVSKVGRSKKTKENATPTTNSTTPLLTRIQSATNARFLTPTQSSSITPNVLAKKTCSSASKAMPYPKLVASSSCVNPKTTSSAKATKTLSRENSNEDFRKDLQQLADERKKQREQKHLLAAQQREAKERERAERMAKLAKEREEKRLKKQMEAEERKRELEEIKRKFQKQEEAEAAAAAKQKAAKANQEREHLMQMKQSSSSRSKLMPPPAPKSNSKYVFEMLHEDDSTDDEGKVTYKRPPPPSWSRSHVRVVGIAQQQHFFSNIIDSFFSVQPTTPDLKQIFPDIDARHLKRNSSAVWSTPPRYSELPKY